MDVGNGTVSLAWGAEGGALASPMAVYDSSAAFGGRYITSSAAESGTATWTVNITKSRNYVLWCRVYAGSTASNSAYFRVDGGTEDTFDIDASADWKWRRLNGRGSSGVPLSINPRILWLTAGTHTIRLRSRESYVKFDRLILTTNLNYVPTDAP